MVGGGSVDTQTPKKPGTGLNYPEWMGLEPRMFAEIFVILPVPYQHLDIHYFLF